MGALTAREVTGLAALDERLAVHGKALPDVDVPASAPEYIAWVAGRNALAEQLAVAEAAHAGLICRKCIVHGRVQWSRCNRLCFQCNGDGWTAKGRRQHAAR